MDEPMRILPDEAARLATAPIAVSGLHGFLGANLREALQEVGCTSLRTLRGPLPMEACAPDVDTLEGDLRDPADCRHLVRGCRCVVHLAAVGGGFRSNLDRHYSLLSDNLLMTLQVLRAAVEEGVERFVLVSSSAVYGTRTGLLREEDAGPPFIPAEHGFATAKWTGEEALREACRAGLIHGVAVRPTNPYGPHDSLDLGHAHFIPAVVLRLVGPEGAQGALRLFGRGDVHRNFTYARDVARGIVLALVRGASGASYNLGAPGNATLEDVARTLARDLGMGGVEMSFDPEAPVGHPGRVPDMALSHRDLGYEPAIDLAEGLRRTVAWYRTRLGRTVQGG